MRVLASIASFVAEAAPKRRLRSFLRARFVRTDSVGLGRFLSTILAWPLALGGANIARAELTRAEALFAREVPTCERAIPDRNSVPDPVRFSMGVPRLGRRPAIE